MVWTMMGSVVRSVVRTVARTVVRSVVRTVVGSVRTMWSLIRLFALDHLESLHDSI